MAGTPSHRLGGRNTSVSIPHLGPGDDSALDNYLGFGAEEGRLPQNEIRQLPNLQLSNFII